MNLQLVIGICSFTFEYLIWSSMKFRDENNQLANRKMEFSGVPALNLTNFTWVCNRIEPSLETLAARGNVPVCLNIRPVQPYSFPPVPKRTLCLDGSEDISLPPVWCYQDTTSDPSSYYLWWSSCENCGTAWRLFRERKNDESWYKLPESPMPFPSDVPWPLGSSKTVPILYWQRWNGNNWESVNMIIEACDSSENESFPSQCYAPLAGATNSNMTDPQTLAVVGIIVVVLIACGCCCVCCACICYNIRKSLCFIINISLVFK